MLLHIYLYARMHVCIHIYFIIIFFASSGFYHHCNTKLYSSFRTADHKLIYLWFYPCIAFVCIMWLVNFQFFFTTFGFRMHNLCLYLVSQYKTIIIIFSFLHRLLRWTYQKNGFRFAGNFCVQLQITCQPKVFHPFGDGWFAEVYYFYHFYLCSFFLFLLGSRDLVLLWLVTEVRSGCIIVCIINYFIGPWDCFVTVSNTYSRASARSLFLRYTYIDRENIRRLYIHKPN